AVVVLAAMPLTANGKIDKSALPAPDYARAGKSRGPVTVAEEIICRAFAEILGLERVGAEDNFFELGGHSLLVVLLAQKLTERGLAVAVWALFQTPTPAGLAATVGVDALEVPANRIPDGIKEIPPDMLPLIELTAEEINRVTEQVDGGAGNVADIYPLAPLQEGVLFHYLLGGPVDVYLSPMALVLDSRERLDKITSALQQVIDRHDIYRTSIVWEGLPEAVQVVWRKATLPVREVVIDAGGKQGVDQLVAEAGTRMDLRRAPLLGVVAAEEPGTDRWLAVVHMHHIVQDHMGMDLVMN